MRTNMDTDIIYAERYSEVFTWMLFMPFAACCLWRTPELYSPIYFSAKDLPHSREETKRYGRVHFCRLGGEQFGLLCRQHSPTPLHRIQVT